MSNELQVAGGVVAVASPGDLLGALVRAASDQTTDIDKMERLFSMHQKLEAAQAERQFNEAMSECQREMGTIGADMTNSQTRSKYTSYAKLDRVVRPIYTKHGISISFDTGDAPKDEYVRVLAYVSRGGYTRTYKVDIPADGKGAKGGDVMTKTHASGAAISYGSRYLLKSIFNLAIGEEDADGNTGHTATMPEGQKADFLTAIDQVSKDGIDGLWEKITKATITDAETRDELRKAMIARKKVMQ
jgi:hypothetical protein